MVIVLVFGVGACHSSLKAEVVDQECANVSEIRVVNSVRESTVALFTNRDHHRQRSEERQKRIDNLGLVGQLD